MRAVLVSTRDSHTMLKYIYKPLKTLTHPRSTWALARSAMFSLRRPPYENSISSQDSSHPHEVARILITITEILAASAEIQRDSDEVFPAN